MRRAAGKSATIRIHRAKLGAAKQIGLIGDDFASLESSGKVLADTTKARQTILSLLEKDRDALKQRLEKAGIDLN